MQRYAHRLITAWTPERAFVEGQGGRCGPRCSFTYVAEDVTFLVPQPSILQRKQMLFWTVQVDVMVGVSSHAEWSRVRLSILDRLMDRGWSHCLERYSVSASDSEMEYQLARGDLFLCVRTNPRVTLDIATYLTEGPVAYAQKRFGCYWKHVQRPSSKGQGSVGVVRSSSARCDHMSS